MKLWKLLLLVISLLLVIPVYAALSFGSGVYTNICGTGLAATGNNCNQGCNTGNGTCSSSAANVVKYSCDGKLTECRSNESAFQTSQSLANTACGKTIQIDVFNKTCRQSGNWSCTDANLKDYFVWYSGDCQAVATPTKIPTTQPPRLRSSTTIPSKTPTRTPTMTPSQTATRSPSPTPISLPSTCDGLTVTAGNNAFAPEMVTLKAKANDPRGAIQKYRFLFGDGKQEETTSDTLSHRYEFGGSFTARVEALDSRGSWIRSNACETTVTLKSLPIESHRGECADIVITSGNYTQAPTTAKFQVIGYDNKGSIQGYRVDFGQGVMSDSGSSIFEHAYPTAGTFTVRGYIKDSKGNWVGGTNNCTKQLYINTKPLTTQPSTGTPTGLTIFAIGSGLLGIVLFAMKKMAFTSR